MELSHLVCNRSLRLAAVTSIMSTGWRAWYPVSLRFSYTSILSMMSLNLNYGLLLSAYSFMNVLICYSTLQTSEADTTSLNNPRCRYDALPWPISMHFASAVCLSQSSLNMFLAKIIPLIYKMISRYFSRTARLSAGFMLRRKFYSGWLW
jgi:hypothetical protein